MALIGCSTAPRQQEGAGGGGQTAPGVGGSPSTAGSIAGASGRADSAAGSSGRSTTQPSAGSSGGTAPAPAGSNAGASAPATGTSGAPSSAAGSGGATSTSDAAVPDLDAPITPGDPGAADITIEVRTDRPTYAISPLIYGTNGAPDGTRTRPTITRSGGNRMTAYNWENNASNAGSDWMFQNDAFLSDSDEPAKPILDGLQQASMLNAASIVTVPLVDYVAADKNGGGDVRNSGSNYLTTRFKQNKAEKGSAFAATPDATDAFVYQDEFVAYLKAHAPAGLQVLFSLDNEPDLWSHTHEEVHPMPVTYAELWERNQRFATAIKRVWPDAPVLGFVSYGWNGYVSLQNASDAMNRNFIDWYLDQAKAAENTGGERLIDYLDLHWYPEARGGDVRIIENNNTADVVAVREQAPRSLWDKTYNETSWIHDYLNGPIYLVPRLREQIDAHYPGTKLAITEWNFGGGDHISGAIACADVLGILGREGVDLATYWALKEDERFAYAALRAYRNYDGSGATFGDLGLFASTSAVESVSVYASLHSAAPERVVLVAINKAQTDKSVGLRLAHPSTFAGLDVYRIGGTSPELTKQASQSSVAANAWKLSLPAQSVSVLVPQL